jgi:hypothetical protein
MKTLITSLALLVTLIAQAQYDRVFHPSTFKKFRGIMRSIPYKTDDWEAPLMRASIKSVYPEDVQRQPAQYIDSMIHWVGIVKEVSIKDSLGVSTIEFILEQKHWDYIEDYSIQDEIMFVSPLGDGSFKLQVPALLLTESDKDRISKMAEEKKLFLCYGQLHASTDLPLLIATGIKVVDYKFYSTAIFTYDIERDTEGHVVLEKNGIPKHTGFKMLRIAKRGQNKN